MSQFKGGAILSYLSLFITIIVSLIYIPILIRFLGQSEYGLYALIGSIAAYFSVMDLGLGNTIVRYNSRNIVSGNKSEEAKLNGIFLILYSVIGFITIFGGITLHSFTEELFQNSLSPLEIEKAKIMILILTINFALTFPLSVFTSIMQAYEKFIIVKALAIARTIAVPAFSVPLLLIGHGAVSIVLLASIINILFLLFNLIYSLKVLKVRVSIEKIKPEFLKEIIGYSFFVFIGVIVDQIYWNTGQLVLGILSSTSIVAIYAIAMQIIRLYIKLSSSISGLFLPKASKMVVKNVGNSVITQNMIKFGRIQFYIIMLFLSIYILIGKQFIEIWAGKEYYEAFYIGLIILIPLSIPLIQNFGISILYAKNKQKFRSLVLIIIALINLGLSFYLADLYGGIGVAFSTSLSLILGNIIVMNIYYHISIGIDMIKFWKSLFKIIIPLTLYLIISSFIINFYIEDLIILSISIIAFIIFYFLIIYYVCFNNYEKKVFNSIVRKILLIRRI